MRSARLFVLPVLVNGSVSVVTDMMGGLSVSPPPSSDVDPLLLDDQLKCPEPQLLPAPHILMVTHGIGLARESFVIPMVCRKLGKYFEKVKAPPSPAEEIAPASGSLHPDLCLTKFAGDAPDEDSGTPRYARVTSIL